MSLGRKRKLTEKEEKNLQECLAVPYASEQAILRVWNISRKLQQESNETSTFVLKTVASKRLRGAKACFEKWRVPKTEQDVWMPSVVAILQYVLEDTPAWASALKGAYAASGGVLHPILYHDDVVCGNILAVFKNKKITAAYLSFRELFPHVALEAAWVPLLVMQRMQQDKIPGGLSAVIAELVKRLHLSAREGFELRVSDAETLRFRFAAKFLFLSDMDAQRATWTTRGSSGLKPCMFCCNVTSKYALDTEHEAFCSIASAAWDRFVFVTDEDFLAATQHLQRIHSKAERQKWEKAYGLSWEPHGLQGDRDAQTMLPPSAACNDVLHLYYANGVASLELALCVANLSLHGHSLQSLRDFALRVPWKRLSWQETRTRKFIDRIFSDKMFESKCHKGDGDETRPLVFLLCFVLCEHVAATPELTPSLQSFASLHAVAREIRALAAHPTLLQEERQVAGLRGLQCVHQRKFCEAYGEDVVIPKHHHRLHLPDAALKLQFLPQCEIHESKHRVLKSGGLVDRQKGKLHDHEHFQYQILCRLLDVTRQQAKDFGLARWEILPPVKLASPQMQAELNDETLETANRMQLRTWILKKGEPIILEDKAYVVQDCLSGKRTGLWLTLLPLQLINHHPWGSQWLDLGLPKLICKPKSHHMYLRPVWWHFQDDKFTLLH